MISPMYTGVIVLRLGLTIAQKAVLNAREQEIFWREPFAYASMGRVTLQERELQIS